MVLGMGLVAMLALGVPVAVALGMASLGILMLATQVPPTAAIIHAYSSLDTYVLVAIPGFVMAGQLVNLPRTGEALRDLVDGIAGRIRGGPIIGATIAALFFAGITGSSAAEAAAMGKTALPTLDRMGYPRRFSAALLASSATLGVILPPSTTLIIFGSIAQLSITKLFLAGLIPGVVSAALICALSLALARRAGYGTAQPLADGSGAAPAVPSRASAPPSPSRMARTIPILVMPVILVVGIYTGWMSATESAGVLAIYALLIATLVYGDRQVRPLFTALREVFLVTAMIYTLVMGANLFSFAITYLGLPLAVVALVHSIHLSALAFLLLLNLLVLLLGMFLDGLSIVLFILPAILPVSEALGISSLQLAIVLAANIEIAVIHPPVGLNLFIISRVAGLSVETTMKAVLPYIALLLCILLLFTLVPGLSTWLPAHVP
jgi:C4-dicarboxylate transporter DctM subunit